MSICCCVFCYISLVLLVIIVSFICLRNGRLFVYLIFSSVYFDFISYFHLLPSQCLVTLDDIFHSLHLSYTLALFISLFTVTFLHNVHCLHVCLNVPGCLQSLSAIQHVLSSRVNIRESSGKCYGTLALPTNVACTIF